ncbi:MAG: hypothetical protein AAFX46_18205, partial [Cyanobacteria bacterium J06636_27]
MAAKEELIKVLPSALGKNAKFPITLRSAIPTWNLFFSKLIEIATETNSYRIKQIIYLINLLVHNVTATISEFYNV